MEIEDYLSSCENVSKHVSVNNASLYILQPILWHSLHCAATPMLEHSEFSTIPQAVQASRAAMAAASLPIALSHPTPPAQPLP